MSSKEPKEKGLKGPLTLLGTGIAVLGSQIAEISSWAWAHPTTILSFAATLHRYVAPQTAVIPEELTAKLALAAGVLVLVAIAWRFGKSVMD